jgi:hypothetical protein
MTSQPSGKPSAASADPRRVRWLPAAVLVFAAAGLWGGPAGLDELRAVEARLTGRPEIREACSFRLRTGLPCLGCGGTHALGAVARGDIRRGFAANPLGATVGLAGWALVGGALASLLFGRARPLYWTIGLVSAALPAAFIASAVLWWHTVGRSARDREARPTAAIAAPTPALAGERGPTGY